MREVSYVKIAFRKKRNQMPLTIQKRDRHPIESCHYKMGLSQKNSSILLRQPI